MGRWIVRVDEHLLSDRDYVRELVRQAREHGYKALTREEQALLLKVRTRAAYRRRMEGR